MTDKIKIHPSLLAADYTRIGEEIKAVESAGADGLHLDVMDGQFVPNLNFGPPMVSAVRRITSLPLDVHLMIVDPDRYVQAFVEAGADMVTVHIENHPHIHRTVQHIKQLGVQAGVAINPGTPVRAVSEIIDELDLVLMMSVNPGWGGQQFIEHTLRKIGEARRLIDVANPGVTLSVDGGITANNASLISSAGASLLVAGSSVFAAVGGPASGLRTLRDMVTPATQGT